MTDLGANFSGVRVYTGPTADQLTNAINARAFTYNNNIVFGKGEYSPGTTGGKRLMAHELTHVMQQNHSVQRDVVQREALPPYHEGLQVMEELARECNNMTIIGGRDSGRNSVWTYEMLVKGTRGQWEQLLRAIGFDYVFFDKMVLPFIKTALDPTYGQQFLIFDPANGRYDTGYGFTSINITQNDILAFLYALYTTDQPGANGARLSDDANQALAAFIIKYQHMIINEVFNNRIRELNLDSINNLGRIRGNQVNRAMLEGSLSYLVQVPHLLIQSFQNGSSDDVTTRVVAMKQALWDTGRIIKASLVGYRMEMQEIRDTAGTIFDNSFGVLFDQVLGTIDVPDPLSIKSKITSFCKDAFVSFVVSFYNDEVLDNESREDVQRNFEHYLNRVTGLRITDEDAAQYGFDHIPYINYSKESLAQHVDALSNGFSNGLFGVK